MGNLSTVQSSIIPRNKSTLWNILGDYKEVPEPYLFYSKNPNGTGINIGKYILSVSLFSTVGEGVWFDAEGNPITRSRAEIAADVNTNTATGDTFYSATKGCWVGTAPVSETLLGKLGRYFKFEINPAVLSGWVDESGSLWADQAGDNWNV